MATKISIEILTVTMAAEVRAIGDSPASTLPKLQEQVATLAKAILALNRGMESAQKLAAQVAGLRP